MKAFLWGVCLLCVLAGMALKPTTGQLWLVKLPNPSHASSPLSMLQAIDADLVDILDQQTIIVKAGEGISVTEFYRAGALAVINSNARYGCGSSTILNKKSKET